MRKRIVCLAAWLVVAALFFLPASCASLKDAAPAITLAADTAPELAQRLDDVYAVLIKAKAVPDHREKATKALASLDAIAEMVHAEGANLAGDKFNWASFVINAALTAAKIMGVWA